MSQPHFEPRPQSMSVGEIAALVDAQLLNTNHAGRAINGIAALDRAGPADLCFLDNPKYAEHLAHTRAGACLISKRFEAAAPQGTALLRTAEPYQAFVAVARKFYPGALRPSSLFASKGAAAGANVHRSARIETNVSIDPGVVVGPDAEIGSGTVVAANAVIGANVRIGRDCSIGAGTSISHSIIGDRVIIHPGCCIGPDGFGFVMGAAGHRKIPQIGRVIIQDDVEIGAGTTIDRGAIRDTVIGEGTKIDNLVQIGHNVTVGRHCILVAQTGISGSATLEDFVVLGARVGVNNHVTIGEGAQIAATGIVHGNVPAGARWGGTPAKPVKQWFREMRMLERMAERDENPAGNTGRDGSGN
jgi:UDP-3-O-[3-hydroxymyristoyl] glucosamine N-acyltransferase